MHYEQHRNASNKVLQLPYIFFSFSCKLGILENHYSIQRIMSCLCSVPTQEILYEVFFYNNIYIETDTETRVSQKDYHEKNLVYVASAKEFENSILTEDLGEGLFMKQDVLKGKVLSYFNGVRKKKIFQSFQGKTK